MHLSRDVAGTIFLLRRPCAGPIPPELGNLGALMQLGLHENELAGEHVSQRGTGGATFSF